KRAYCLKTQPATGETYPKSDLFNKAAKMGNNLVKALAEAGYVDTPRRRNLQAVYLLPETQAVLQRLGQQDLISILEGKR
ncbi:BrxA family protein, partial [Klebsiella pneumoniae]|uniref:BrxA family protein n=1 Tax=Klebsiella pneumoniae TaxID=573 RepID=UPI0024DEE199